MGNKKIKILVVARVPRAGIKLLDERYEVVYPDNFIFTIEELKDKIQDVDGVLSVFIQPFNAEIIGLGKKLKIIANFGVGYNNIDVAEATKRGIVVCNTPDAVTEPTAEMAFGLLLSLTRRIAECDRKLRLNPAFKWGMMENLGTGIYGKTLGIIGMGRIGMAFARRAHASGMRIIYYNRTILSDEKETESHSRWVAYEELLKQSDVISLHCPLTDETYHLIDEKEMAMMKKGVILINTSRGAVVNERSLIKYLQNGHIGGAGLDVFENEPKITPELLQIDQVVLSPHNATGTIDTRIEIAREASANIIGFFEGRKDISIVNPVVLLKNPYI